MKKLVFLALLVLTIAGCKEDLTFNTPSFDAIKNNEPWRANNFTAYLDADNKFNVKGELGTESVILTLPGADVGTYNLVAGGTSYATYKDATGLVFSTQNNPDPSLTLYPVGGKIVLENSGALTSGRFQFSAFTLDGLQGVTFSGNATSSNYVDENGISDTNRYGVFYRINFSGANANTSTNNTAACTTATDSADAARIAYEATAPTDANFATVCSTYKSALEVVIATCTGSEQTTAQTALTALPC